MHFEKSVYVNHTYIKYLYCKLKTRNNFRYQKKIIEERKFLKIMKFYGNLGN